MQVLSRFLLPTTFSAVGFDKPATANEQTALQEALRMPT
jgi:hypothetical protein